MTRTTIPAELMRIVRSAVIYALGGSAERLAQACLQHEEDQCVMAEPLAQFDAMRALLDAVGWLEDQRAIDLDVHGRLLAMVLREAVDRSSLRRRLADERARA